jgi:hypothetical protein
VTYRGGSVSGRNRFGPSVATTILAGGQQSGSVDPISGRSLETLQRQLAATLATPASLVPDRNNYITQLQQAIARLTKSTDDLNATNKASLNPLYNGRDALKIGYTGAASGMDMMVRGGIPGVDSVPIHIMAQQGERVRVTPAGQTPSNDNAGSGTTITNNFVFNGRQSNRRRSERQLGQRYGQMMHELS